MDTFELFVAAVAITMLIVRYNQYAADAKLRESNPEAWLRLKELELDKERMKHEDRRLGAKIGAMLVKIFFGK